MSMVLAGVFASLVFALAAYGVGPTVPQRTGGAARAELYGEREVCIVLSLLSVLWTAVMQFKIPF